LKARIFAQGSTLRIGNPVLISDLLILLLATFGRAEVDHFARMAVRQQDILVRMGFFLAAVVLSLLLGVFLCHQSANPGLFRAPERYHEQLAALAPVSCPWLRAIVAKQEVTHGSSNSPVAG